MPGENHRGDRIGWLRAAVLGANDGLVSTSSLVVGVAAAEPDRAAILLAAVAGLAAGALSMAVDGAPAKKLMPGSYFSIAAGIPHTTAVDGDQPCVFYIEREGAFDVVLKDAAGGKKN